MIYLPVSNCPWGIVESTVILVKNVGLKYDILKVALYAGVDPTLPLDKILSELGSKPIPLEAREIFFGFAKPIVGMIDSW